MSEELKPCPFCEGEVSVVVLDDEGNIRDKEYERDPYSGLSYAVAHDDPNGACPIATYDEPLPWLYDSRDAVVHAWNRRAERTCRVEAERRKLSQTQTAVVKTCSGCGFEFGVEKENTLPFEVTLNVVVPPNYCPHCGARVIKEES